MKRVLLVTGSYLLVIVLVFGKALNPTADLLINGDDIHRQYYFYREFFNYFIGHGIFPWWNPYLFGGEPFIANPVVNIWYPPTWLFTVLPLNLAYSFHLALHILIAMLGMWWLLRKITGEIKEIGAWAGGLIFGLSGFFMARIWAGHVDVIAAASFMPWVVGAFWKVLTIQDETALRSSQNFLAPLLAGRLNINLLFRNSFIRFKSVSELGKRSAKILFLTAQLVNSLVGHPIIVIAASLFAIQLYAGYQTMAFFTVEAVGIVTLLHCCIVKSLKPLLRVMVAGILGLGLAALQLIPEQEFFRSSIRTYALPYSWNSYGAITFESLKQLVSPFYFGDQLTYHGLPPNYPEQAMFMGLTALILAFLALTKLLKSLKGFKIKTENLPVLSFAAVAIFGLWMALGPNAPPDLQKLLWQILPTYRYLRIPARHLILVVFGLSAMAGIGLTQLGTIRVIRKMRGIGELMTVGLILFELVPFGQHFILTGEIPEVRHDPKLIELFKKDPFPYRVLQNFGVWLPGRDTLDFDSVMSYRIFSATGYDPSILKNYYEYFARASGKSGSEAILAQDVQVPYVTAQAGDNLDTLNIKYLMVPPAYDPFAGNDRYRLLRQDLKSDYHLYENTTVLPRFYLSDKSCGKADIALYTPNRIELDVESSCSTKLMSSEVWYPGWTALVDGRKTVIYKTDNVFRTLLVAPGKHTIIYVYQPTIFYISGGISLLAGIFLITLLRSVKD